jgi:hypothetical protein
MTYLKLIMLMILTSSVFAATPEHRYDPSDPQYVVVSPEELTWKQIPGLPEGALFVMLEGKSLDASSPFTIRQKLPPYTKIRPHYHSSAEHLLVLSGVFYTKPGETFDKNNGYRMTAGGYMVNPPRLSHIGWTGKEGAVVQINGVGPWDRVYLDEERK